VSLRSHRASGCDKRPENEFGGAETVGMAMKAFALMVVMLALLAMPAHAQMGGKRHSGETPKSDNKNPKADEKAYKAALDKIPTPKEKYDPWGSLGATESKKNPK
jgi:hypothetical protein